MNLASFWIKLCKKYGYKKCKLLYDMYHMMYYDFFYFLDIDDSMIRCSNDSCMNGMWFHLECVGLDEVVAAEEDWWCSEQCRSSNTSQFCLCRDYKPTEETIKCSRGERCEGPGIFHRSCVDICRNAGNLPAK